MSDGHSRLIRAEALDKLVAERCHECFCHTTPPCSACENCAHPYTDDCDNDCQECEIDHD